MWLLIVLALAFPATGGGGYYSVVGSYANRDACLRAEATYNQHLGSRRITARTACTNFPLP